MSRPPARRVTELLTAWKEGNREALDELIPVVYNELHRLAHCYMSRERPEHILGTTALVNEVYLRLRELNSLDWQDRNHFFAASARLMRRVLVDVARARKARKRGGEAVHVQLDEGTVAVAEPKLDLVDLDVALKALESLDPRKAKVIELRFFGGFTVRETAEVLGVSTDTVMRDWRLARSWLFREMSQGSVSRSHRGDSE